MASTRCCLHSMMRRFLPALCFVGLALAPMRGHAKAVDEELRANILRVIQTQNYKPAPKIWKKLGIGRVNDFLAELALDVLKIPVLRRRATLALAEFPSTRTQATLVALIKDTMVPMEIRRQALMSLGRAFPSTALDTLRPRILEGVVQIKEAAVLATIPLEDRRVAPLLQDRLVRETDLVVRAAVEKAIKDRRLRKERAQKKKPEPILTPLRPDQRDGL